VKILEMEDTYYFSQGRLISITPYNKFKEDDKNNTKNTVNVNDKARDSILDRLLNFQIYNKSILRYKL
jgi:hypothetical protein